MKRMDGFTLIELIFVIIILGILAAFAIPRYMSLSSTANTSAVKYFAGSLKSAAALVHSVAKAKLATGTAIGSSVNIGDVNVDIDATSFYPQATNAGIVSALETLSTEDYTVTNVDTNGSAMTIGKVGVLTPSSCSATYNIASGIPVVSTTTSGCT